MFVDEDSFMSITTWDTEPHAEAVRGTRDAAQRDLLESSPTLRRRIIAATVVHDVQ
jgi:hypothetical protein